ncbi:MAG TPA: dTDP-4-dehydrorhamnose 3,5-epimerase [Planctomycetota bacterium]|nr:dTDP-4-dehydrorhamnose 3,5-epimerase [Planctomycetota bacterium]
MKAIQTDIQDVLIIEPSIFEDARGYFFESWNKAKYEEVGITNDFVQDNESKSSYGVLRGLHFQIPPYAQAKLVRVIVGKVLDVAVDIRRNSPTFGQHVTVELSGENKRQLFIPRGFAHGFVVLSQEVVFSYKCDNIYMPTHDRGIVYNDSELQIDWKIPTDAILLSDKDKKHPSFAEVKAKQYF